MATTISAGAANAAVDAITALLNGGHIEIRTGAQPAGPGAAATGTLLGTLTLSATAFGTASGGTATANAITGDTSADASGTAGWFRGYTSASAGVIDGAITATGGGGDMELDNTGIVAGGTIDVSSWTITMPTS